MDLYTHSQTAGSTDVQAVVDGRAWETSIWGDRKSDGALLAVPARIRGRRAMGTPSPSFTFDPEDDD